MSIPMKVVKEGWITSTRDFVSLKIVDWTRIQLYWQNSLDAMESISSWFVGRAYYQIIDINLTKYPERDDFPTWKHIGDSHNKLGRLYWNHFKYSFHESSVLTFGDCPDLQGKIVSHDLQERCSFCGDIGEVSPIGMREGIQMLNKNTYWISVQDAGTIVLIIPQCDIFDPDSFPALEPAKPIQQLFPWANEIANEGVKLG